MQCQFEAAIGFSTKREVDEAINMLYLHKNNKKY